MRKFYLSVSFIAFCLSSAAQSIEKVYPKTLVCPQDTFYVRFSNTTRSIPLLVLPDDTVNCGTDGMPGTTATIYYGKDSVTISASNAPYEEVYYIPVESPKGKTTYLLQFNAITAYFPEDYIRKNKGTVQVEVPEAYELANIIWTLSTYGLVTTDLNTKGEYYDQVISYFRPFMHHPLFEELMVADSVYYENYYDFRENSLAFHFKGDKLVSEGPYYYVMGEDWKNHKSLFSELLPLIEDFARRSKFRQFYKRNIAYYETLIDRQKQLMPIEQMWKWLETEFTEPRFQSYKIIFSPLIGGSHSTQNFYGFLGNEWFGESVMFVCAADRYDRRQDLSEKQREGLMAGIVFTEIDHNYVNPASYKYEKELESIFSKGSIWTNDKNNWHATPTDVFNEYYKHAVFCLWVQERYDAATAEFIISNRESFMVDRRRFIRFKEFNRALMDLRKTNPATKMIDMYPAMLGWCKKQYLVWSGSSESSVVNRE